jgi:hypothetical protein
MDEKTHANGGEGIGDPNTPATVVVGVVFAVLLVVCVVLLQAYFNRAESEENLRKVVAVAPEELSQARADQLGVLNAYRWIDEKAGVVGIPVERAMELVVAERAAGKR